MVDKKADGGSKKKVSTPKKSGGSEKRQQKPKPKPSKSTPSEKGLAGHQRAKKGKPPTMVRKDAQKKIKSKPPRAKKKPKKSKD